MGEDGRAHTLWSLDAQGSAFLLRWDFFTEGLPTSVARIDLTLRWTIKATETREAEEIVTFLFQEKTWMDVVGDQSLVSPDSGRTGLGP